MKVERFDNKYKLVFDNLSAYNSWYLNLVTLIDGTDDIGKLWYGLRDLSDVLETKIKTHVTETVTGSVYVLVDFDTLSVILLGVSDLLTFYS